MRRDAARRDGPQVAQFVPTTNPPEPEQVRSEAMVVRGTVKSVVAGWTTMVLASEVERLRG